MRIGVLSGNRGWHLEDLARAAAGLSVELAPLDYRSLLARVGKHGTALRGHRLGDRDGAGVIELEQFDRILVRAMPGGSLEQVVFRMDALHRLVEQGVPVINHPRAIECAVDKYLASARLAGAGLPLPETRVAERAGQALEDFQELGGDVVVKPIFGSEGRGMLRVSDPDLALRVFTALERVGAVVYQQEFIPHEGADLRVLVAGGRAIASMRRRVPGTFRDGDGDGWRTNVSRGGRAEPHELSAVEADLAARAAGAVGTRVAGVDLLPAADGRVHVLEVNAAPGWRALARVTGIDVAREILLFLSALPGVAE